MSTFGQDAASTDNTAKAAELDAPKDDATKTEVKNADKAVEQAGEANTADETDPEMQALEDRGDPDSNYGTAEAAGAAESPHGDGTIRNNAGKVTCAPHGSKNAAVNGVQTDASGHFGSVGTDNSSKSGTRI